MNIERVSGDTFLKDENDSAFWTLSPGARITRVGLEVINLLWTMRCP